MHVYLFTYFVSDTRTGSTSSLGGGITGGIALGVVRQIE